MLVLGADLMDGRPRDAVYGTSLSLLPVFRFSARPEPGRLGVRAAYDEITLAVAES